ncbi:MAG: hypothetical protein F4Z58_00890 [Acidimicrobiaceae bacterium]|nr:hypothetical protein [Acidimicrobiaceae bacterium]MYD05420.1 hypothetical protein [Acidimicrobiaceae bacterium]MYI59879.1 hypothetical protein [Acidimicrobiaceae bacterium]
MKATIFDEPKLDFAYRSSHVDPRAGITDYGPVDLGVSNAPTQIRVGVIGSAEAAAGVLDWLRRCRRTIDAKANNKHPHLFRGFPGFTRDCAFRSELIFDDEWTRVLSNRQLRRVLTKPVSLATAECVDLYHREIADLAEKGVVDVILIARPDDLEDDIPPAKRSRSEELEESTRVPQAHVDFHDLLKAATIVTGVPLQLIRSTTWDPSRQTAKTRSRRSPSIQDEATRAWNLHTALYYKAGGIPWRVSRESGDLDSLYVGVSFFHSTDRGEVHTSVAQIFDERGEGVVVRGGPAARQKDDRQPHLRRQDAEGLLGEALDTYVREHQHYPARVVLHKTSQFDDEEVSGFESAVDERHIRHLELLWIVDASEGTRLFRKGDYPVLRGTFASIGERRHILYTRGSVEFYRVYPGMYIPTPLGIRPAVTERSIEHLAEEVLALSKMNWNQSQLDGRLPITLRASRKVAGILKNLPDGSPASGRYAMFM